jgi:hypothetical protein
MTDTTKKPDNVIPRRRASDWQKPLSVSRGNVFGWFEGDGSVVLEERARARVSAALDGAKTIAAILMQLAIDRDEDDSDNTLRLSDGVEHGLLAALASCIETAEVHSLGVGSIWTTCTHDDEEADAVSATVSSINADRYRKEAGKGAA